MDPSGFQMSLLKIGTWEYRPPNAKDLAGRVYYSRHKKMVWQMVLDEDAHLKSKMAIRWSDIYALNIVRQESLSLDILELMLISPPHFYNEPYHRAFTRSVWEPCPDFTPTRQATTCRRHYIECELGSLDVAFGKMMRCDANFFSSIVQRSNVLSNPSYQPAFTDAIIIHGPSDNSSSATATATAAAQAAALNSDEQHHLGTALMETGEVGVLGQLEETAAAADSSLDDDVHGYVPTSSTSMSDLLQQDPEGAQQQGNTLSPHQVYDSMSSFPAQVDEQRVVLSKMNSFASQMQLPRTSSNETAAPMALPAADQLHGISVDAQGSRRSITTHAAATGIARVNSLDDLMSAWLDIPEDYDWKM